MVVWPSSRPERSIAMIRRDVEGLLPGVAVRLDSEGPAGVSLTGDLTGLDGADIDYVCGRVSDALQALAARQRSREELEHERVHDALTGLPNRLQLASTLAAACGQHDVVCVAVLDVDRFTEVNTAFGEAAGDEVLRTLARTLEPAPDVAVLRLASDDFALVTGSDSEESALLRVRRAINSIPPAITVGRGVAPLTVSVGVALARMDATAESDDLFSRALAALQIDLRKSLRPIGSPVALTRTGTATRPVTPNSSTISAGNRSGGSAVIWLISTPAASARALSWPSSADSSGSSGISRRMASSSASRAGKFSDSCCSSCKVASYPTLTSSTFWRSLSARAASSRRGDTPSVQPRPAITRETKTAPMTHIRSVDIAYSSPSLSLSVAVLNRPRYALVSRSTSIDPG